MDNDTIRIERFSKKRYETYKKKGIPFHVVSGNGRLCEVKAFDCGENKDQVFVESTYKYCGKNYTDAHYANQKNGYTKYKDQDRKLFIYLGPWFNSGKLVVQTEDGFMGRHIFFWRGIHPRQGEFCSEWEIYAPFDDDMSDTEFYAGASGEKLKGRNYDGQERTKHFRIANDKDRDDYRRALRAHRIAWESDGRFYHYPHVGDRYFEIFFNHGVADFRERVMDSEANRPEISRLIMECNMTYNRELRESRVRERVEKINKALGLK